MSSPIAQVALDLPVPKLFDYIATELTVADIGKRVRVPFGRKYLIGVVMALVQVSAYPSRRLKAIAAVLDEEALLPSDILRLLQFCSEYYHYPLGATVMGALPAALRRITVTKPRGRLQWQLTVLGMNTAIQLPQHAHAQRALLAHMQNGAPHDAASLAAVCASYRPILKGWLTREWVSEHTLTSIPSLALTHGTEAIPDLNPEQSSAVDQIADALGRFQPFLLHGVTGSGKTEVYLRLAQTVLAQGGQVLVMVPEINLTPQLTQRFQARFTATEIVTLHSAMGENERLQHWLAAAQGRAGIILGTRLAIFTPMPKLALIVIDEEHDSSFFQQEGLRYAARDVAILRAQQRDCPVVLGSATPSLETWHNAQSGRYRMVSLKHRAIAAARLPAVRIIDARGRQSATGMSAALITAIQQRLQKQQQSLVFINRRGYAPTLVCRACGWAAGCAHCSARLVVHLRSHQLRCHHCGFAAAITSACPDCGNLDLNPSGFGTQRLEQTLQTEFPDARILRIDRDSTQGRGNWQQMQQSIRDGEVDIMVGTQLLTKGHDFPNITLVGVIGADSALYSPDFRASEHLFAQLMQVSGRAGRAQHAGEVLIQTEFVDHPLYLALQQHDYPGFAGKLLSERSSAGFPPFVHQAVLRAEAPMLEEAIEFLQLAQASAPVLNGITLFNPTPAVLLRKANLERALLLVQSSNRRQLQHFLSLWSTTLYTLRSHQLRWHLDVDPLEI